jgi:ribosome-associated protein
MWRRALETLDTARLIVDVITGMAGADVLLLDISAITLIADYFVIATADSNRQLDAITQAIVRQIGDQAGVEPRAVEGTAASGWVLLDYGAIVVHLFSERQRDYYRLEELWSAGRTIVRMA